MLCHRNQGPLGLWDSKQDPNRKKEFLGTRISLIKLNVMLFDSGCLALKTSVYFDTVLCNLVCCKYLLLLCFIFKPQTNKKKRLLDILEWVYSCLTILSLSCGLFYYWKTKSGGMFSIVSVVCKYHGFFCQVPQSKHTSFSWINGALGIF